MFAIFLERRLLSRSFLDDLEAFNSLKHSTKQALNIAVVLFVFVVNCLLCKPFFFPMETLQNFYQMSSTTTSVPIVSIFDGVMRGVPNFAKRRKVPCDCNISLNLGIIKNVHSLGILLF